MALVQSDRRTEQADKFRAYSTLQTLKASDWEHQGSLHEQKFKTKHGSYPQLSFEKAASAVEQYSLTLQDFRQTRAVQVTFGSPIFLELQRISKEIETSREAQRNAIASAVADGGIVANPNSPQKYTVGKNVTGSLFSKEITDEEGSRVRLRCDLSKDTSISKGMYSLEVSGYSLQGHVMTKHFPLDDATGARWMAELASKTKA